MPPSSVPVLVDDDVLSEVPSLFEEFDDLADSFKWVEHYCAVVVGDVSMPSLSQVGNSLASIRMSTAFTGIGAMGTARSSMMQGFQRFAGVSRQEAPPTFAIDINEESR